jgi:hypothetical protein
MHCPAPPAYIAKHGRLVLRRLRDQMGWETREMANDVGGTHGIFTFKQAIVLIAVR